MMNCFSLDTVFWFIGIITSVIETNRTETIHVLVWPPVAVLFFLCVLIALCGIFGCKYTCRLGPPEDVVMMADYLEKLGIYTLEDINPEDRERMLRELAPSSTQVNKCNSHAVSQASTEQLDYYNASVV